MPETLTSPWKTTVGRDAANLHRSLAKWLGERLIFLAKQTQGHPPRFTFDEWVNTLAKHGEAMLTYAQDDYEDDEEETTAYRNAQNAMFFVTRNLGDLWD